MTETPTGYESVSDSETITRVNAKLLSAANLAPNAVVVDLGCGTGSVTKCLLSGTETATANIVGVDPSQAMLDEYRRRFPSTPTKLGYAQSVERLFERESVDAVVMANCIHLVGDIPATMSQIHSVLRSAGRFLFNSGFHSDAFEARKDTGLLAQVVLEAFRICRSEGLRRVRPRARPLAKRPLHRQFYVDALRDSGFEVLCDWVEPVAFEVPLIQEIVGSEVFAKGALPGFPVDAARKALQLAVQRTAASNARVRGHGIERQFLQFVAIKR